MPASSNIVVYVDAEGHNNLIGRVNRDVIVRHSAAVKNILDANSNAEHVVLRAAPKGALEFVVGEVLRYHERLYFNMSREPFERAVPILMAVQALGIQPEQPQVEGHVVWEICQNPLTPARAELVAKASEFLGIDSKPFTNLVQRIGYDVVHDKITEEEKQAFRNVAVRYPALNDAIGVKVAYLRRLRNEHLDRVAQNAGRRRGDRRN